MRSRSLIRLLPASPALIASLAFTSSATAQEVIHIGVQPATMPIYIAQALGYLDEAAK